MKKNALLAIGLTALMCACQTQPTTQAPSNDMKERATEQPASCPKGACQKKRNGCCEAEKPATEQKASLEQNAETVQKSVETKTP